tara:strand:+ start:2796 stop:2990 length:195 start_codon:yes stop_codon:yes gene_type:complete
VSIRRPAEVFFRDRHNVKKFLKRESFSDPRVKQMIRITPYIESLRILIACAAIGVLMYFGIPNA